MLGGLFQQTTYELRPQYEPKLPHGAVSVLDHQPTFGEGAIIEAGALGLIRLDPYHTYEEFKYKNLDFRFLDATVLDALIELGERRSLKPKKVIRTFLGDFSGQVFFLNTHFQTPEDEVVSFISFNTRTPAFRGTCPVRHMVRPDVPVYAAVARTI